MRGIALSLAGIVLVLFVSACQESSNGNLVHSPNEIEFTALQTRLPQIAATGHAVFRSEEAWEQFWIENRESNWGDWQPPVVDFETKIVVGIFWGLEWNGCIDYENRVHAVQRSEDMMYVNLIGDPPSLETCPAETYASLYLEVERADGSVMLTGAIPQ